MFLTNSPHENPLKIEVPCCRLRQRPGSQQEQQSLAAFCSRIVTIEPLLFPLRQRLPNMILHFQHLAGIQATVAFLFIDFTTHHVNVAQRTASTAAVSRGLNNCLCRDALGQVKWLLKSLSQLSRQRLRLPTRRCWSDMN